MQLCDSLRALTIRFPLVWRVGLLLPKMAVSSGYSKNRSFYTDRLSLLLNKPERNMVAEVYD